jgi:hypothetical protein
MVRGHEQVADHHRDGDHKRYARTWAINSLAYK